MINDINNVVLNIVASHLDAKHVDDDFFKSVFLRFSPFHKYNSSSEQIGAHFKLKSSLISPKIELIN